jgi:hypothetical protein
LLNICPAGLRRPGRQSARLGTPCLPAHWDGLKIHYRYRETVYHIAVSQTRAGDDEKSGVMSVTVDGVEQDDRAIPLVDDHLERSVGVTVNAKECVDVPTGLAASARLALLDSLKVSMRPDAVSDCSGGRGTFPTENSLALSTQQDLAWRKQWKSLELAASSS